MLLSRKHFFSEFATLSLVFVDERKARCEDQQFEVLGIDVEVGGQPAGPHSRTKPRGQDEKGAMAGTSSEPSKTNHGEITLDLSAAGRSGGRVETRR